MLNVSEEKQEIESKIKDLLLSFETKHGIFVEKVEVVHSGLALGGDLNSIEIKAEV